MISCSVYVITNKITGKKYVGVSNNPQKRFYQHAKINKKTKSIVSNAINQYGIENFSLEVLLVADRNYCFEMEKKLIFVFNTLTPNGYNICKGGKGSSGLCGELNGMFGKTGELNPQYGKIGDKAAFFGRKHSEETKEKMRKAHFGKVKTNALKQKMKEIAIKRWQNPEYRQKVLDAKMKNRRSANAAR